MLNKKNINFSYEEAVTRHVVSRDPFWRKTWIPANNPPEWRYHI